MTTLQISPLLDPALKAATVALAEAAALADGVQPLSEAVRLTLAPGHGADAGAGRHLVALDDTGSVIGYAHLDLTADAADAAEPADPESGPVAELVVAPERRGHGIGALLLEAARAEAEHERPEAPLKVWAHGSSPAALALAARHGLVEVRRLLQMRRSLAVPLPPVALPQGFEVSTFRPGVDDRVWLDLNRRAFAHHPEQGRWTATDLSARLAEPWFDPAGFFLVTPQSEPGTPSPGPVGFHWTKVEREPGAEPLGEVYVVGIDPAAQGRGLGKALTLIGLHHLAERGVAEVALYVESDNAPARAVYEGLGFTIWGEDVLFGRTGGSIVHVNVTR